MMRGYFIVTRVIFVYEAVIRIILSSIVALNAEEDIARGRNR